MQQARDALRGRWGLAVAGSLIYFILGALIQCIPQVGWIGGLIIGGPLLLGLVGFFLAISRKQETNLSQLFDGFQNFVRALITYILMVLFIILWAFLFIIPGIVAALSYSPSFFLLSENPKMEGLDLLRKSKSLMRGNRWKLFCLFWRFFGWFLLCLLSLGIGFLWLMPYVQTSLARFYDDLSGRDNPLVPEGGLGQPSQP